MMSDRTVAETIETLTERLQESTLLDDRRDACRGLRSLSKDYRVEVCAQAMEALLQAIKNDRHDPEMINYCLDSLNYIISGSLADSPAATWPDSEEDQLASFEQQHQPPQHHHQQQQQVQTNHPNPGPATNSQQPPLPSNNSHYPTTNMHNKANMGSFAQTTFSKATVPSHDHGRELAEIFLKKADNVTTILDTLVDNDFKTRWVAVRLLCGLARQKLATLQECILSFPLGASRLAELISEELNEVIRNDVLVLFVRLTRRNQDMQNLLVFQDCFDKIMNIIEVEGYLDGTVAVVMDCLTILLNLIQHNESNQILFRDKMHIQKMMPLFNNVQSIQWTNEKTSCLVLALQIIDSMIIPTNQPAHVRACQTVMQRCGLLDKLCELLTASSMPIGVLSETINTASDIVRGHLGPNANMVMPTSAMMPVLLLSMVKEMCQDQETRISELYNYMHVLYNCVSQNRVLNR